jgi:hypothetical protein
VESYALIRYVRDMLKTIESTIHRFYPSFVSFQEGSFVRHLVIYYCLLGILLITTGVSMYHNVQLSKQVNQLHDIVLQVRGTQAATDLKTSGQASDLSKQVKDLADGQAKMQAQLKDLQNKTADIDAWVH